MSKPVRYQRTRLKGHHKPAGAVYVGKQSSYGNREHDWKILGRAEAARRFEADLLAGRNPRITVAKVKAELPGKDVYCWCPLDEPCHADVLLRIANANAEKH